MKHWKTYTLIVALIATCLFACSQKARAGELPEDELYPGTKAAIAQMMKEERNHQKFPTDSQHDEVGPLLKEPEKRYTTWLYVGGFSHHDTEGKPNTNKEDNFALGGSITTRESFYGFRPVLQGMHVFSNSKKGTTDVLGFGVEACFESLVDLCGSVSRVHARANDPRKNRTVSGWGYMPTVSLGKGRFRVYMTQMAPKITYTYIGVGVDF